MGRRTGCLFPHGKILGNLIGDLIIVSGCQGSTVQHHQRVFRPVLHLFGVQATPLAVDLHHFLTAIDDHHIGLLLDNLFHRLVSPLEGDQRQVGIDHRLRVALHQQLGKQQRKDRIKGGHLEDIDVLGHNPLHQRINRADKHVSGRDVRDHPLGHGPHKAAKPVMPGKGINVGHVINIYGQPRDQVVKLEDLADRSQPGSDHLRRKADLGRHDCHYLLPDRIIWISQALPNPIQHRGQFHHRCITHQGNL